MAISWNRCREPMALRRFGRNPERQAVVLLLGATAAWGATFVVVKDAVTHMAVAGFLAWRFIVAAGLLAILRPRSLVRLGPRGWARGVILGWALTGGYLLQTLGLRYTTAAVSGFLTGLSVVITPLLAWWFLRQRPRPRVWVATAMALCGLGVMSLSAFSFGLGEFLTIASAVSFSLQIVGLARWASSRDAYALAAVQLLTVAACCSLVSLPSGPRLPASGGAWAAVAVTAVMATCFAFIVQSWAQTLLSPSRTALILTMEPVFAALAAWVAGESIGWSVVAGGAMVVAAMLLVELAAPTVSPDAAPTVSPDAVPTVSSDAVPTVSSDAASDFRLGMVPALTRGDPASTLSPTPVAR